MHKGGIILPRHCCPPFGGEAPSIVWGGNISTRRITTNKRHLGEKVGRVQEQAQGAECQNGTEHQPSDFLRYGFSIDQKLIAANPTDGCALPKYEGLVNENPFSRLRLKRNPPLILPRTLPLSAIESILESAYQAKRNTKTKEHRNTVVRDIAVLELLFATGVRATFRPIGSEHC